jgi:transcriptional regulator with XRE-family HTH domain
MDQPPTLTDTLNLVRQLQQIVRNEMIRQGVSQADLADKMGLTTQAVNNYLSPRRNPKLRTFYVLMENLGYKMELEVHVKLVVDPSCKY